jgi:hypothetical protein
MKWDFTLERKTLNRLNPDTLKKHLGYVRESAERNKSIAFEAKVSKNREPEVITENNQQMYRYHVRLRLLDNHSRTRDISNEKCKHVLKVVAKAARSKGWDLITDNGVLIEKGDTLGGNDADIINPVAPLTRPKLVLPPYDQEAHDQWFSDVYERDAHIRIIYQAIQAYVESDGEDRSHVLLEGKPAGCKTRLFERFKTWLEDEGDLERVAFIDGPTMTKAGLENWLLDNAENGTLPEIIVIEEIEKQAMDNLLTLLSVMGSGYVSKTNARIGRNRQDAKVLVFATCNDLDKLLEFRAGALYSRFTHQLHCVRPSRELMGRILEDKIRSMRNGKMAWAKAALEFAYDELKTDDPRKIVGLLNGRDKLLTGEYQNDYRSIMKAWQEEKKRDLDKGVAA